MGVTDLKGGVIYTPLTPFTNVNERPQGGGKGSAGGGEALKGGVNMGVTHLPPPLRPFTNVNERPRGGCKLHPPSGQGVSRGKQTASHVKRT